MSVLTGMTASPSQPAASAARVSEGPMLWYDEPAQDWESEALPIGNGALGAMIFGAPSTEHLQLNEKTLWTGGPGAKQGYDFGNWRTPRPTALQDIRRLIDQNLKVLPDKATEMLAQEEIGFGDYQPLLDLKLDMNPVPAASGYRRHLDIKNALAGVQYEADRVRYTREYFASAPGNVLVARLSASKPGKVGFTTTLTGEANRTHKITAVNGRIKVTGTLLDNGMRYETQAQVINSGGTRTDNPDGSVTVTGADSVVLVLSAGTDYADTYPAYRGEDPGPGITRRVDAASRMSYDGLRARHIADHRRLFDRVSVNLGQVVPSVPTDDLLSRYREDTASLAERKALEVLFYQYGRYLLIASSRDISPLPANLQGVWNKWTSPPWRSDYHVNINLQMNYWLAETTNLSETTAPLFDFVDALVPPGRVTAKEMFGADGWVVHSQTNPFGFTGVIGYPLAFWMPDAGAWLAQHYWEHYQFTRDKRFLKERAYPLMKELAAFWLDELQVDPRDSKLVVSPSFSPEHGDYSAGAAMPQQIVWDLFTNLKEAAPVVGESQTYRAQIASVLERLDPGMRIGSWGQLQEWKEDWDDPTDQHRHTSQLFGLHPGRQLIPSKSPELAAAAAMTLKGRGDGGTGWSKAWKINFWARLLDGNHSHKMLSELLKTSTLKNLWDTHPPFQIDGNFGATAGMTEMLLQSHAGSIDVLPALPDTWADKGSYDGLRARGAFTVGATWQDGAASEIRLRSDQGEPVTLRNQMFDGPFTVTDDQGRQVDVRRTEAGSITFGTSAGRTYLIRAKAQIDLTAPKAVSFQPVEVKASVSGSIPAGDLTLAVPAGWKVSPATVSTPAVKPGRPYEAVFTVTPTLDSGEGDFTLVARLKTSDHVLSARAGTGLWRVNLARGKTATQSTTAHNAPASRAVDGNTSGSWGDNSVTHTAEPSNQAWWQVDLGKPEGLSQIAVWNRTDCCSDRLSNYWIIASENPITADTLEEARTAPGVTALRQTATAGTPTLIDLPVTARHIRIQLESPTAPLSLAEVKLHPTNG
ncbi:glycosyl hydrolase family 95 catalytic domain-containing protein [Kribbella deserti]|uniref:Glycoside hydrolase N-terminal domain-containing protein n=1 Tax=Kribbella deserti TaxID=1926257 RepID=A0ABV6QIC0_9ACTN